MPDHLSSHQTSGLATDSLLVLSTRLARLPDLLVRHKYPRPLYTRSISPFPLFTQYLLPPPYLLPAYLPIGYASCLAQPSPVISCPVQPCPPCPVIAPTTWLATCTAPASQPEGTLNVKPRRASPYQWTIAVLGRCTSSVHSPAFTITCRRSCPVHAARLGVACLSYPGTGS